MQENLFGLRWRNKNRKPSQNKQNQEHSNKQVIERNNVKDKNWEYKQLPAPPFPNRVRSQKLDRKFNNCLDLFKQFHINRCLRVYTYLC